MPVLGIRCSNSDYAYAVVDGDTKHPTVIEEQLVVYPKDYQKPKLLRWFYQEIEGILTKHRINRVVIKGAEAMATRDKAFVERTEHEAIAILSAGDKGITVVARKMKATIAKDLGMKGRAKYLDTKLDKSAIEDFDEKLPKIREAILAAWSALK